MFTGGSTPLEFRSWEETGRFTKVGDLELGENDVPKQKFRKEIIRTGKFVKQLKNGSRQSFEINTEALDHWAATFSRMNAAGIRVNIPDTHDDDGSAKKSMGYVTAMERNGDKLEMECMIVGAAAIEAAHKSDVSIKSPVQMEGDDGTVYKRPIEHVAMVTNPVISGLGDFVPLAASRSFNPPDEDPQVKEFLQGLVGDLSLSTEITDDADTQKAAVEEIKKAIGSLVETSKKVPGLEKDLSLAKTQIKQLEKSDDYKPDPLLVSTIGKSRAKDLELLVEAGKITPAVRDALAGTFIGDDNKALELSLAANPAGAGDVFDAVVNAFKANAPVKVNNDDSSGPQVMTLSRLSESTDPSVKAMQAAVDQQNELAKS